MLLAIFGKVIKHSSFGYLLHDIGHLVNRPLLRSEVETATIEPSISFIIQVNRIQLTKHSHGCYSVQNGGTLLEIASVAETHEGKMLSRMSAVRRPIKFLPRRSIAFPLACLGSPSAMRSSFVP